MTEHDDQIYLEHIADMSAALNRTARRGKEAFLSDPDRARCNDLSTADGSPSPLNVCQQSSKLHIPRSLAPILRGSVTARSMGTLA